LVELGVLADDLLRTRLEFERCRHSHSEHAICRLHDFAAELQLPKTRARQQEFDQHGLVWMGDGDVLIALIREWRARGRETGSDGLFATEGCAGTLTCGARVLECRDALVPVMGDFQRHVAVQGLDAAVLQPGSHAKPPRKVRSSWQMTSAL
jgi:hypothetical protein